MTRVAIIRLRSKKVHDKGGCTCSLNSELEDYQKSAIEEIVWSSVLKYKPFVIDRHLVRALVESWALETKAFRIDRREVPFLVHDAALLTGFPTTRKHITFDEGQLAYEEEEVDKAAVDDYLTRERARRRIGWIDIRNIVPFVEVRELERREATVKAFSETDDFNSYVEDVQDIISIEEHLRRTREALQTTKEVLRQNEGLELAHTAESSAEATETRIATSEHDDSDMLHTKLHTVDVIYDAGEGSKSSIAKRIQRSPQRRHPLVKQISPKATTHRSKEQEAEEIRASRVEVEKVATKVLAVVPVAAGCCKDQEPTGIHSTKGQLEEEQVRKTREQW
ncbi:hypothetical protein Cgig2_012523 [Carnegiea gigantea]|uniref:Uncharacterized protein n=1 Tax=Carnegiea gigantea TaxID=171969 RepID=A0A9Q1JNN6_9CARY|nr:hypothetical protein Cgig2_012523 [Carnegiea gigantea]